MITQSGAEGISLKNVRQVHIVEPYWNYIRLNQVIGRAVRTCSHINLPPEDRNVTCYIYYCVFTEKQIKDSFTIKTKDKGKTTDEYIYGIAKRKAAVINSLLELLHKASVDCGLNGNLKCFSFPVNIHDEKIVYNLELSQEILDNQYEHSVSSREWTGEVLRTKKGNFLIKRGTNEVYDYDIYMDSNKLVKLGVLRVAEDGTRRISDEPNPSPTPSTIFKPE